MKLQLVDARCEWSLVIWKIRSRPWKYESKRARRHESAPGVEKTRPEKASKWIKLTERKCLEQRDRAD